MPAKRRHLTAERPNLIEAQAKKDQSGNVPRRGDWHDSVGHDSYSEPKSGGHASYSVKASQNPP